MSSIVFDHQTASNLRQLLPGTSFRFESGEDPFLLALKHERSVLIVPGGENGTSAVLKITRMQPERNSVPAQQSSEPARSLQNQPRREEKSRSENYREERREGPREPRGILGLDGDAVYLDEEELEAQRPWWQRLFRS